MFKTFPEARPILRKHIQRAVSRTLENLTEGDVKQEPQITERLMARIEDEIKEINLPGVSFHSITFTDRGRNSEESRFGADFAGFLTIQYSNAKVVKVFLSQAKLGTDGESVSLENLDIHEKGRLLNQIDKMLTISAESYVTIFTRTAIKFIPALSIKNALSLTDSTTFWRNIPRFVPAIDAVNFYEQHFECFIGDTAIEQRIKFPINSTANLKDALAILRVNSGQSILATTDRPLIRSLEDRG